MELLNKINRHSETMEHLYSFVIAYEDNGTIPDATTVWPNQTDTSKELSTIKELKTRKKNLQSANSKDEFILLYQMPKKCDTLNPLPDGNKKTKILNRIKNRKLLINEVEEKIINFNNAD